MKLVYVPPVIINPGNTSANATNITTNTEDFPEDYVKSSNETFGGTLDTRDEV